MIGEKRYFRHRFEMIEAELLSTDKERICAKDIFFEDVPNSELVQY